MVSLIREVMDFVAHLAHDMSIEEAINFYSELEGEMRDMSEGLISDLEQEDAMVNEGGHA